MLKKIIACNISWLNSTVQFPNTPKLIFKELNHSYILYHPQGCAKKWAIPLPQSEVHANQAA
jgi:hypothetical protein